MKKKLRLFNRILYIINLIAVILLVVSFALPYIPPKSFPVISLLSLVVSPLILINILFVLYWLFKLKTKLFYSLIVLIIAHFHFGSFMQYSKAVNEIKKQKNIKILSYNVRLFNAYEKNPEPEKVALQFSELLNKQEPDILCIQEYYADHKVDFSSYKYQFIHYRDQNDLGHSIFSKYPILNTGSFDFSKSHNNTIYADILINQDTIRVYNLHLQSLGIIPNISTIQEEDQQKFRKRVSRAFKMQQEQTDTILEHQKVVNFPTIISGDFNNTPYSYIYHSVSENFTDAFDEKGNGIGTTYLFDFYPTRIDYIFVSEELEVQSFKNVTNTFSDHYPITSNVLWK